MTTRTQLTQEQQRRCHDSKKIARSTRRVEGSVINQIIHPCYFDACSFHFILPPPPLSEEGGR